jgi:hypothetical protein
MSRVFVSGFGAVSPAGWGVPALRAALRAEVPLPTRLIRRPEGKNQELAGGNQTGEVDGTGTATGGLRLAVVARPVPEPRPPLACLRHPRLRRASLITYYAVAAADEALGSAAPDNTRLGIVVCLQGGCVQYSYQFFDEVLKDPATASPMLFPETVLAAPASHVAAVFPNVHLVHTLEGDPATFLQALALGADWLLADRVEACLVIGAEETNWLLGNGLWVLDHQAALSGGAGAVCLTRNPQLSCGIELAQITDAYSYTISRNRRQAAQLMRAQLPASRPGHLLCDGLQNSRRTDAPERAAWSDWTGPRLSPKLVLGEGLMAAGAWQCVAACDALAAKSFRAAIVSVVGCNQQAIGARFTTLS